MKIKRLLAIFVCALYCGVAANLCAQGLFPKGPPTGPQLMVSVFSGMQNPILEVTPEFIATIRAAVDKLPAAQEFAVDEGKPARFYGGFYLGRIPLGKPAERYLIIRVMRRGVELRTTELEGGSPAVTYKYDKNRTLELALLKAFAGDSRLPEDARSAIAAENIALKK